VALSSITSGSHWQLTLAEEFVLVSHAGLPVGVPKDEHEGAVRAACLLELGLAGKLVAGERRSWLMRRLGSTPLRVRDATPTGDSLLDEVLVELAANKVSTCRGLSDAYRQRLLDRSLLSATGRSRVLRVARYEPTDAGSVARTYARLRAALDRPDELDVRTVALTVALSHPHARMPLLHAAAVVYEQIDPRAASLRRIARNKKEYETFIALFKLPEAYRAQVMAQSSGHERESALAMCDVIDAVGETRSEANS
jgi:hypothetical protein